MGLLLRSAMLSGGSTCAGIRLTGSVTADVRVDGEYVAWIDPPGTLSPAPGDAVHDLSGYLLLPAPVEPHAHLDAALLTDGVATPADVSRAGRMVNPAGSTRQDVLRRARRAAQIYLAHGATAVRSHVDVGGQAGLRHLEALLQLRDELRGLLTVQLVAVPAAPTTGAAGSENARLLRQALTMGADLVGGVPFLEPEPQRAIAGYLEVAAAAGIGVDLHVDETPGPGGHGGHGLADLARQVLGSGFSHPVTASHCLGVGARCRDQAARMADAAGAAGVSVVALPQSGLFLQGRDCSVDATAAAGSLSTMAALLDAGVTVGAGGGHLRNPYNPMGRGDALETASLLVTAAHLAVPQAYTAVSASARAVMALPPMPPEGVLHNGVPAELLAVRADSLADAIAAADGDRTVISAGRIAVRTRVTRSYPLQPSRS